MKRKKTKGEIVFNIFNFIVMTLAVGICLYPLWYVLIGSFSNGLAISTGKVTLWPVGFNFKAYEQAFSQPYMGVSYLNTIFYSVVGTGISMTLTALGAYPLSKKRLAGRKLITLFVTFTMWFSAGMMPTYIILRTYGLLDTRLGVLLHGAVSTFYVIIMRTAFEGVPDSLEESMKIDGASDFQIFFHTYLPLTVPTLMTLKRLFGTMFKVSGLGTEYTESPVALTVKNVQTTKYYDNEPVYASFDALVNDKVTAKAVDYNYVDAAEYAGGAYSFSKEIFGYNSNNQKGLIAAYDANDMLIAVKTINGYNGDESLTSAEAAKIKILIWDKDSLKPLIEVKDVTID